MNEREAFDAGITKLFNSRYRPESYDDLFLRESSLEKRIELLKVRFSWSNYQAEEAIRMIRILLPTSV